MAMRVQSITSGRGENKMDYLWCIEHEHEVKAENSMIGICHSYSVTTDTGWDLDWCWFDSGWATCEPPTNFEDDLLGIYWNEWIVVPSNEELAAMEAECY
jgi:hypothetical protein